jgi:hypothetical protein
MRATPARVSTVSEPLLRLNPPEVSRRSALKRDHAVIEEPFTPEELCRRPKGLLGSPRNAACAEPRLGGEDRLILRQDEVFDIGPKKES